MLIFVQQLTPQMGDRLGRTVIITREGVLITVFDT